VNIPICSDRTNEEVRIKAKGVFIHHASEIPKVVYLLVLVECIINLRYGDIQKLWIFLLAQSTPPSCFFVSCIFIVVFIGLGQGQKGKKNGRSSETP
jgi:hypothetical protein